MKTLKTVFAISLLLVIGAGCPGRPSSASHDRQKPEKAAVSEKTVALRLTMRRLWEDHITWTRQYIVSVAGNLKDKDVTAARLMRNQSDIGDALKTYYGEVAGDKIGALLKEHIEGAVKILDAAKAGGKGYDEAVAAWRENGDQVAEALSKLNPENWPADDMKAAMRKHLDTTLQEADDRLHGKYAEDVQDFDVVKDHIYMMSDMLSDGIIKQFPSMF